MIKDEKLKMELLNCNKDIEADPNDYILIFKKAILLERLGKNNQIRL